MNSYTFDITLEVFINYLKGHETLLENAKRSELQTYINAKAHNWINKKENVRLLLSLIFEDDLSLLDN